METHHRISLTNPHSTMSAMSFGSADAGRSLPFPCAALIQTCIDIEEILDVANGKNG